MPVLRLEQATVHALPYVGNAVNHQCIYWDETFACFGPRIYPSGRRTYVCSYRIHRTRSAIPSHELRRADQAD